MIEANESTVLVCWPFATSSLRKVLWVNQPSHKIPQNSYEEVSSHYKIMWVRRQTKMSVIGWTLCQETVARAELLEKRTLHAQSTSQLSLCGFCVILLQIHSQDMDLWEIVWSLPLKVVLEGTPCHVHSHPSESHPSLSVP